MHENMQSQTVFNFTRQLYFLLNNILQPPQKKKIKKIYKCKNSSYNYVYESYIKIYNITIHSQPPESVSDLGNGGDVVVVVYRFLQSIRFTGAVNNIIIIITVSKGPPTPYIRRTPRRWSRRPFRLYRMRNTCCCTRMG